jgi:trypsin
MKFSSLAVLGLFLSPSLVLSQTKTGGPPTSEGEDEEVIPLTLLEKNKLAKDTKGKGGLPSGIDMRVVGGQQVTQESKYPFFVQWEDAYCGGSLIHDDIVLSAAHCENRNHPFLTRVFVNGIESGQGVFRTVIRQESHPLYKVNDLNDYDFLLLKLDSSALVDENGADTGTSIVKLNTDRDLPVKDQPLMAVGYGLTAEGGSTVSAVLNDVEVYYVDNQVCIDQYGTDTFTSDLMFCAGVQGGGKDTCQVRKTKQSKVCAWDTWIH